MSVKRKLKTLTFEEKRQVLKAVDEGTKKKSEIAKSFGIPPNTLSTILKNRGKYESDSNVSMVTKRVKGGEFSDVDECVFKWLKQCRDKNVAISGPILKEKAVQFAESLGHPNFRASNGWLQNFKRRNEIIFKKVCGESASVDMNVCDDWKKELSNITESYSPENIFNADETGLFFKCLPDKTLTLKGDSCNGGKNSKDRITVLFCVNATGSDKIKPLVIGKSLKPRCFKNVTSFPTDYLANKKAWMTQDIFSSWLKEIDKDMKKKKRKILLFIDNCSAHGDVPVLKNVRVEFLPVNTTSKLQPLDQGIIKNFKVNYRKEVVRRFLMDMEKDSLTKINVLDALWMTSKAWNSVTETTVKNCFKKCGFETKEPEAGAANNVEPSVEQEQPIETNETVGGWHETVSALNMEEMEFEEYVAFDDDVAVCGELSDTDIVASVTEESNADKSEDEDDVHENEEPIQPEPTLKEARAAIEILKHLFGRKCEKGLSESVVKCINDLDTALDGISLKGSKQTKIDDFFKA